MHFIFFCLQLATVFISVSCCSNARSSALYSVISPQLPNCLFCFVRKLSSSHGSHRTSPYSGWRSCFLFRKSRFEISASRPPILSKGFREIPQLLLTNTAHCFRSNHDCFLPNSLQLTDHPGLRRY